MFFLFIFSSLFLTTLDNGSEALRALSRRRCCAVRTLLTARCLSLSLCFSTSLYLCLASCLYFCFPFLFFFSCLVKRLSWTIKTRFEKRLDFFLVEIWRTTIIFQMCVILWGGNICVSPIGWKTLRCHESFKVLWFFDWFVQWWMDQFWVCFSVRKWLSSPTLRDNLTAIGFFVFSSEISKEEWTNHSGSGTKKMQVIWLLIFHIPFRAHQ